MKVLITGATGTLGLYIVKYLYDHIPVSKIGIYTRSAKLPVQLDAYKDRIEHITGDIQHVFPLKDVLSDYDHVIHAAGLVSFDPADKTRLYEINVLGTRNMVNLSLEAGIKRFIHVSSVAALGRSAEETLISEKTEWEDSAFNNDYAISKYHAELEAWRGMTEGMEIAIVNPCIILGSGDWRKSSLKLIAQIDAGIPFYPKGSTAIVDARDAAKFIGQLLTSDINGERYILAGTNVSYKNLFQKMAKHLGSKVPKKPLPDVLGGMFWRWEKLKSKISGTSPLVTRESLKSSAHKSSYDHSKSTSVFDFQYRSLEETLRDSIDYYKQGRSDLLDF